MVLAKFYLKATFFKMKMSTTLLEISGWTLGKNRAELIEVNILD